MTIEVRQMLIRSNVGGGGDGEPSSAPPAREDWREAFRQELLSECKAWLEDRLRRERER